MFTIMEIYALNMRRSAQQGQYVQKILHNVVAPGIGFQLPQEAGIHPGVAAALHVRGEAVSQEEAVFFVYRAHGGKDLVEECLLRLLAAHLFGDEHAVELRADAGISKPYLLGEGVAVGDGVEFHLALDGV